MTQRLIRPPRLPKVENRPGWEVRWQLTLIEPAEEVPPYMMGAGTEPKPRLNLVLSRTPTKAADAIAAAEEFLMQTRAAVPGLEANEAIAELQFKDGKPGAGVTVSFLAAPDVRLRQRHLFRIDDGQLTQAVVTSHDARPKSDTDELVDAVLDFVPESE
jgi:hypothetical protein